MIIKIGVIFLAMLGLVFVIAPYFNYAFFDFQCEENPQCISCSARTVSPDGADAPCKTIEGPEAGCYQNCASREKRCGFDEDFKAKCIDCILGCEDTSANTQELQACYNSCYVTNATSA